MRPGGESLGGWSRKDHDRALPAASAHGAPTSFFLATEDMISRSQTGCEEPGVDSTFGVRSLEETTCTAVPRQQWRQEEKRQNSDGESDHPRRQRSTLSVHRLPLDPSKDCIEKPSSDREYGVKVADGRSYQQLSPLPSASQSSTSLSQASQAVGSSLPSSPKSTSSRSFRPSDEDSAYDGGSQAIASSEEEEGGPLSQDLGSTLQLIMPSINMPRRRPFTARGKGIGRFKILVAGDSGKIRCFFLLRANHSWLFEAWGKHHSLNHSSRAVKTLSMSISSLQIHRQWLSCGQG